MKIYFFVTALIFSQTSLADSLVYFETLTHKRGPEAKVIHEEILRASQKLQILECPITLIERQWGGLSSVKDGIYYLQEYINISENENPDFESINTSCNLTLERYQRFELSGFSRARALLTSDLEEIKNIRASSRLINLILESVNQDTLCYANRTSIMLAAGIGMSAGKYKMECYTPLGRRFRLRGPSVGIVGGIGGAISLPDRKSRNHAFAYRFSLFLRSEEELWKIKNNSKSFASIFGMNAQHDTHKNKGSKKESMFYEYDLKAAVGGGIFADKTYQLMSKKDLSPLFIRLIQTHLFNKMTEKIKD